MLKGFAITIAIVLLLPSVTFAEIDQGQQFVISTSNDGVLTGAGIGAMFSVSSVPITNFQEAIDGAGTLRTVQMGVGSLIQGSAVSGAAGSYGYEQGASIIGTQSQTLPGYLSLGTQDQDLGTAFTQGVFRVGNLGSAMAVQNFVGGQNQFMTTPYGVNAGAEFVGVGLVDGIGGQASTMFIRSVSIERTVLW
jgi:hypothetical protein